MSQEKVNDVAVEIQTALHRLIGDYAQRERHIKQKDVFIQGVLTALARESAGLIMTFYSPKGWVDVSGQMVEQIVKILQSRIEQIS